MPASCRFRPWSRCMKLYYSPGTCSLADHIVLEWIGKPYEAIRVSRDDRKSPEFLRLNPAGAVQVLQDGDWVLTQNMAVDRTSVVSGTRVSVRVDLGGRRIIKQKNNKKKK